MGEIWEIIDRIKHVKLKGISKYTHYTLVDLIPRRRDMVMQQSNWTRKTAGMLENPASQQTTLCDIQMNIMNIKYYWQI